MTAASQSHDHDGTVLETIQSLLVAFVLAMAFRGFVTEGFVIPTGSMAPTLMGRHVRLHAPHTGAEFPVGLKPRQPVTNVPLGSIADPMLGIRYRSTGSLVSARPNERMGDRILVLKTLYPFFEPDRFDVVVFKNPTDPNGEAGNYIKRLIGLPGETVWIVDGDVFAVLGKITEEDAESAPFAVQRKPDHVQRAVWQSLFHSDYVPTGPMDDVRWHGIPWVGWNFSDNPRVFRWDSAGATTLEWDASRRGIDDWTSYNQPDGNSVELVSDIRVAAGIVPDDDGLVTTLELSARSHVFQFMLDTTTGEAVVRMRHEDEPAGWDNEARAPLPSMSAGSVQEVEFWHVDQRMAIYIGGDLIIDLEYDWSPRQRLEAVTGLDGASLEEIYDRGRAKRAELAWHFSGTPLTMHRVRVDRDLHYRNDRLKPGEQRNDPRIEGDAFGTHPSNLGVLGPDHFMMLGDNSQFSLDSRLWGNPHKLIKTQIDTAPFVVNRKLLLGKAWVVYFPSPLPMRPGSRNVIPDFSKLRFIR